MSARLFSEAQIAREARRIFRKLMAPGASLDRLGTGVYALVSGAGMKPGRITLDPALQGEFVRRDWLRPHGTRPESWCLSDAGAGWLARMQAVTTPFAAQHQLRREQVLGTAQGERRITVNDGESPLGWLRRRRRIDAAQFEAGERLRRDYTIAQLTPRLGVDFSAPIVLGQRGMRVETTLSDAVLSAKQRFRAAMAEVGPGLSDMLFDVCCHLTGLEDAERARDWPRRSARVVLGIALDRLAVHYGLRVTARARGRLRAWQAEAAE